MSSYFICIPSHNLGIADIKLFERRIPFLWNLILISACVFP